jgi:hypothetical protein
VENSFAIEESIQGLAGMMISVRRFKSGDLIIDSTKAILTVFTIPVCWQIVLMKLSLLIV